MYTSFDKVKSAIDNGTTVVDVVSHYLKQIEAKKHIHAFLEVFEAEAIQKAQEIDAKIKNNTAGKLAGMVIGIKDNLAYKNHKVSAASKILEGFESIYTATAVERLIQEDAIIIGRLNCDEFAMGSSNENSAFGNVLNPIQEDKVPGGSSGGSAAALAAGLCTASIGSDTGGSIRQPASFTGLIGFKPTYGTISRYGLLAYASSFDQIGPFTNTIKDAALITAVMAGKDEYDGTAIQEDINEFPIEKIEKGSLKVGYISDCLESKGLNPEIKTKLEQTIQVLKKEGHTVEPVSFPYLDAMVPTYYVLTTAEASSNLSRYTGVHFGRLADNVKGVEETYKKSRSEGFGEEVKKRIMLGTFVLSHGYYDAYYTKGQKVRRIIQNKTNELLSEYDVLLLPTTPDTAFKIGGVKDAIQMYLQDIFTVQANLAGNPAISLPMGTHSNGLPFGLQLIGKHQKESELLSISAYLMDLKQ
ncbi:Asp-tRNA(Asn)/Glu-tRNA(Gln) amidotransferase GatCAB subunit A [Putridiphycobacter roseus]|uniref:Glutamyl-tRNA(Gln) amidotransferase subunit A n=1 Tax=Putridiphycobacter roseus TaxID=2219161 RepID=A0A2W1MYX2_9FLAO|nr:Asp-tRNA(Asn)/Glu-tRNA(Gln) amidotransferase subunit GatA [Putridiphycobacter roseus]PZE16594.1 Asp-tRNA(Asn)/Glu-tRNA(Gln) amidotransferase GatCAB subunit A [Putridiphycobacter roseus]